MILIIGLGNPGKKFERTRHNLGFRAVESLKLKVKSFSNWRYEKKFSAEISQGKIGGQKVILAKPQTFMNESGKAVKKLFEIRGLKFDEKNLFVIHDDLDLLLGRIRISFGRRAAGHKGVQSIIDELKTKEFVRFRIGINPNSKPKTQSVKPQLKTKNFVLEKFTKKEEKNLKKVIKKTILAIEFSLKKGFEKAMSEFNK